MDPSASFKFATWNSGSSVNDYTQLHQGKEEGNVEKSVWADPATMDSVQNVRNKLLGETAKDLASSVDVAALQEVMGEGRNDIEAFKAQGFDIVRPARKNQDYTDTAIAIHPDKFKNIENRSFNDPVSDRDFAVAVGTEKATGKKIAFVSGHIPGFNLEEKNQKQLKEDAAEGDKDIKNLLAKLKEACSDCDTVIVGADMNASPEIHADRFNLFKDAGFAVHRTAKPTSLMTRKYGGGTPELKERELDYVFVAQKARKKGFVAKLKNIFKKETVHVSNLTNRASKEKLTLDPISNPSDHIPVYMRVEEMVEKKSVISRMISSVGSAFKSKPFPK